MRDRSLKYALSLLCASFCVDGSAQQLNSRPSFSQVYGDKDADGFYRGESAGHVGFVPCNMVSEIQVEDEETRQQLLQQGFLSTATSMEKIGA